ncbi:hypothetical protein A9W99_03670 [Mycobacterium sp. 1164966.3]|uniref:hypothetical protein n=1 Tax=Mycobacterium sp. 1164966.3 TaxID=1856861 RepID=UPI0007FD0914|nr:hypothetical protein [Mycobacterium sp. 1164966.3]OBA78076.1 hypothetical protein A9W99_03670 [Mycobacterium sp. 1164966.3]
MTLDDRPATSRQYVASAVVPITISERVQINFKWWPLGLIVSAVLVSVAQAAAPGPYIDWLVPIPAILFGLPPLVLASRFAVRFLRSRKILVCVTSSGLTVSRCPDDVFLFSEAQLGRWNFSDRRFGGMTNGTALHLRSGDHRFVLGGRDHRVGAKARLQAEPVDIVDAWMWAGEFTELLSTISGRSELDVRPPLPEEPTRCLLFRKPSYKAVASKPSKAIEVGAQQISVINSDTSARIESAPPAQVTATPAQWTFSGRIKSTLPVLVVRGPGVQPLSIGCLDGIGVQGPRFSFNPKGQYRFGWRGEVAKTKEPAYWVSGADWLALVEKFGLTSQLEDKARH